MAPAEQVRARRNEVLALDALLAVAFALVSVVILDPLTPLPDAGWGWTLALTLPLAARRVWPVTAAAVVFAVAFAHLVVAQPVYIPADLAVLVAIATVTAYGPSWAGYSALGVGLLGCGMLGLVTVTINPRLAVGTTLLTGALTLTAWALGRLRGSRVEAAAVRAARAEQLEVEHAQELRLAAQEERARIAREMHDIVAHSLSVMVAQADGGRYAATADPTAANRALETIAETGRAALSDMRRLLGVLRTDDDAGSTSVPGSGPQALAPQPATGDLEELVEQVRSSGLRVSLVSVGNTRPLPPGVALTVHRICQEALTNVLKHAGPDPTVTVLVQWTHSALRLEVSDDGRGAAADADGSGHGLVGMRERAVMLGGSLTAGPRPGGGFRVRADLPIPPPDASAQEGAA